MLDPVYLINFKKETFFDFEVKNINLDPCQILKEISYI